MDKISSKETSFSQKYIEERFNFCLENQEMYNFQMRLKGPSTFSKINSSEGEIIEFTFDPSYENFHEFEEPFIKLFLTERLTKIGQVAIIGESLEYSPYTNSFYLLKRVICGDLKIDLVPKDTKLIDVINRIITDYNRAIDILGNCENNGLCNKIKDRKLVQNGKLNNGKNS